ncbi:MAG: hypothetical protein AAB932_04475, partial [Patescibacteria group bacterium]
MPNNKSPAAVRQYLFFLTSSIACNPRSISVFAQAAKGWFGRSNFRAFLNISMPSVCWLLCAQMYDEYPRNSAPEFSYYSGFTGFDRT